MDDLMEAFLQESRELCDQGAEDLLALERRSDDRDRLDGAFRVFHTLKGAAGIVEFEAMGRLFHAAEELLSRARRDAEVVTPKLIGDCLACLDQAKNWVEYIEATGKVPGSANAEADRLLGLLSTPRALQAAKLEVASLPETPADLSDAAKELIREQILVLQNPDASDPGRPESASRVCANVLRASGNRGAAEQVVQIAAAMGASGKVDDLTDALEQILAGGFDVALSPEENSVPSPLRPIRRILRVDARRIDELVNLTGEMMVARSALSHALNLAQTGANPRTLAAILKTQHAAMGRIVDELQHAVLALRVLPMRDAFQRLPRLVRDMAADLAKQIELVTEGDLTEADKSIVERLSEPLLHVVRNAVDHGIEEPEERAVAAKPETGTIRLLARREGEHVIVEVEDDGRGINPDEIRKIAIARGIVSQSAAAALTDDQAVALVFAPGISTAREVTRWSGRGVGMDAVQIAVEQMGGKAEIQSRSGRGTTVRFTLPFTLMMTRVMTVEVTGQVFGIPLHSVIETQRVAASAIMGVGAARAFVLRDRTIPLLDLAELVGTAASTRPSNECLVVIITAAGEVAGLIVDRAGESMDVMLKPLDGLLADTPAVSGTAVLGDGRVLVVLDSAELLQGGL